MPTHIHTLKSMGAMLGDNPYMYTYLEVLCQLPLATSPFPDLQCLGWGQQLSWNSTSDKIIIQGRVLGLSSDSGNAAWFCHVT